MGLQSLDLPETLAAAAELVGYTPMLRYSNEYTSAEITMLNGLTAGQKLFIHRHKLKPRFSGGTLVECEWTFLVILGVKFDADYDGTNGAEAGANLDETYAQKYERRLNSLRLEFVNFLSDFACENSVDIRFNEIEDAINLYAENIDAIIGDFVITETT